MTYEINEHKSNDFVQKVTPQKKRVRQLKFSIYTRIFEKRDNSNTYDYIIFITDRFDTKKIIKGTTNIIDKDYSEFFCILEAIKYIYNSVENDYKKFIIIKLFSNNIFTTNLLREWIHIWSLNDFNSCKLPSNTISILKEIYSMIIQIKLDVFWITKTTDETTWLLYSKNSIEEF
jgi:hypothetical protein